MSNPPLPPSPTTPRGVSFDTASRDTSTIHTSPASNTAPWAGSQEHLKEEVDSHHGHVHGPHCNRSTDDLASDWEDTEEEDNSVDDGDDDSDPRGPKWTWALPTRRMVRYASQQHIIDEWGKSIPFANLLPDAPREITKETAHQPPFRRLVVFFVGHWWCGLCHDYALYSVAKLSQAALIREGVRVALISSGSWKAIAKYRQFFHVNFPVYVDRGSKLYNSLGMRSSIPNPFAEAMVKNRPKYHKHAFARQMVGGMANGMRITAFKGSPGNFLQLGGEFVFSPGYRCEFAHRMQGRADHCEAPDVLQAVGVQAEMPQPLQQLPESITRMKSESSAGSSTLVTRIKSGMSSQHKITKSSVGLDEELKEGYEVEVPPIPTMYLVKSK